MSCLAGGAHPREGAVREGAHRGGGDSASGESALRRLCWVSSGLRAPEVPAKIPARDEEGAEGGPEAAAARQLRRGGWHRHQTGKAGPSHTI